MPCSTAALQEISEYSNNKIEIHEMHQCTATSAKYERCLSLKNCPIRQDALDEMRKYVDAFGRFSRCACKGYITYSGDGMDT